ncbi:MAG: class I SAM-dependent methyltransferase [Phycisphaeraceae bacterium]|nr:class I SAM-dependent methyltransferase [Phycisphaeraceae bacterium]
MSRHLEPYRTAIRMHGAGFEALLWHSKASQTRRFEAIASMVDLHGRVVADLGCGAADLRGWLVEQGIRPAKYLGVEAIDELFSVSRRKTEGVNAPPCEIVHADFVQEPGLLERLVDDRRADVLLFSGSLNTLSETMAMRVLDRAWRAIGLVARGVLVFNFLSNRRADAFGRDGPTHRFRTMRVLEWALQRTPLVAFRHDYLGDHDATIAMRVATTSDLQLP